MEAIKDNKKILKERIESLNIERCCFFKDYILERTDSLDEALAILYGFCEWRYYKHKNNGRKYNASVISLLFYLESENIEGTDIENISKLAKQIIKENDLGNNDSWILLKI